jgi:KDO2-lipid IV(A) lauroyltransferase
VKRERRYALEALAARIVGALIRPLPRRAALGIGRLLGRCLAALDALHLKIAVDSLRVSFPDWDEARLRRTARAVYAHFGAVVIDILWLEGRTRQELLSLVDVIGREHVAAAMAAGKGVILCGAHIGNWELHGIAHGWLFGAIDVVARPLDNPALDARLCAFRSVGGNGVVYKRRALAQVMRCLRGGRGVAMLLDQNVLAHDGIFIRFFGRPAAATTVAAALALKTGCALVPSHTELLPDGRYRLHYEPPLGVLPDAERVAEIARVTQELAARTEAWVRRIPEQWLWIHRRWQTQPSELSK